MLLDNLGGVDCCWLVLLLLEVVQLLMVWLMVVVGELWLVIVLAGLKWVNEMVGLLLLLLL